MQEWLDEGLRGLASGPAEPAYARNLPRLLRPSLEWRSEESEGQDDRDRWAHPAAASLCAEELDEAGLDLLVALLQLFRVHAEQVQL